MWRRIQRLDRGQGRRGIVAVQVAFMLVALVGFAALAIDVGYVATRRSEMQNAVDSAALAGASGVSINNGVARSRAMDYAGKNHLGREAVSVTGDDVEIGNWESTSGTFFPISDTDESGIRPNAVRVEGRKDSLPLFFAGVQGPSETNVLRDAVALADGGRCRGIWGLEGVFGSGSIITDSYDSQNGPYGPGNINQNGDICTNRDIDLNGGTVIRGDAMYGPGYDINISGGSYEIWGNVAATCCEVVPPVVDTSAASVTNDNDIMGIEQDGNIDGTNHPALTPNERLRLESDENVSLYPGTYYMTSARMVGQATLTIMGPNPTIIYVDGEAKFGGGGIVNLTEDPANLVIYATGPTLELAGGSGFYGAVIAPDAAVRLVGNADYYGMIIGRTLDIRGDAFIHVDESIVADLLGGDGEIIPVLVE